VIKNKTVTMDDLLGKLKDRYKNNKLFYSVPYQNFTNSIENYFSMFKSRLNKLDGLTYNELKANIITVINNIPKDKFLYIFRGAYNRKEKYIKNSITRKRKPKNYK
jgi:hypothetical protein